MDEKSITRKTTGQYAKRWEDLTFSDNFIFCKVMQDEKLCKELLERLLHVEIEKVVYPETEKTLIPNYESRGIRLDLYVKDKNGGKPRIFDVEMQSYKDEDIIKRARFYQSVIDMDNLMHGQRYKDLPESFIIFICTEDPFNLGKPVYELKTVFKNTESVYNDDTNKIFFNAAAFELAEDEKVRNFLRFVHTQDTLDDFTSKIEDASVAAKRNAIWRKEYMFLYDVIEDEKEVAREIGLEEGRAAGLEEGRAAGMTAGERQASFTAAKRMLEKAKYSISEIAEITGLSEAEIKQINI